jgi:predicted transcriptional regulator of viral defense system
MPATVAIRRRPDWDRLFEVAQGQDGYFTTAQAARSGYSRPLLHKHLAGGRIARARRGVYRVVHFPASDREDLVVLWLWSQQAGVISHETALALHDLSDVLPSKVHLTLPTGWRRRRLRVPAGLILHFADVDERDRTSFGAVPVTVPLRTLEDCVAANLAPGLLDQAVRQARQRGLITAAEEAGLRNDRRRSRMAR